MRSTATPPEHNTANGAAALYNNTTGINNTATGEAALFSNTTGSSNTATGLDALAEQHYRRRQYGQRPECPR